ncbi:MAG: single-stranded DNA-binding protein [Bryobacteraceae bacterium]|nr:single-stranded DNA-binding protein [Bryobacteraceae bacterium]
MRSTGSPRDGRSRDQVVNFPVAVNERWKNRDGEPQEKTTWLRIVAYNGVGQACAEFLRTGSAIHAEGRLQIREYEDRDGKRRTAVEVVASRVRFLSPASNADEKRQASGKPRDRAAAARAPKDATWTTMFRSERIECCSVSCR